MEENKENNLIVENVAETENTAPAQEAVIAEGTAQTNFNDNLHGENLTERAKVLSPGMTVAKRFFRSKLSVIGLAVILFLFLFSFIGPLFSPWRAKDGAVSDTDPASIKVDCQEFNIKYQVDGEDYTAIYIVESVPTKNTLGEITPLHWMGTDNLGYDVLTRLMYGGRVSLTIGFIVILLETLIGMVLGGLAGYYGKWVDQLIMRIVDILSCIPSLPIMLILGAALDAIEGFSDSIAKLYIMMTVLTLIGWAGTARLVRGQILSLREQEFMLAAKCSGLSTPKKIFKHLLPNVIPQLIVTMTLGLGSVILMEATLGFLGIGAPVSTPTWGNLILFSHDSYYMKYYPNLWLGAGICITLAILAFNFVGDGLRDAFDPKMKR